MKVRQRPFIQSLKPHWKALVEVVDRATAIAMIEIADKGLRGAVPVRVILARHPDVHVRLHLAEHPAVRLAGAFQDILARDRHRSVRSALARSDGRVGATVLVELALDEEVGVRSALADRSDLPALVWDLLARDESVPVRLRLARNPTVPVRVLRLLCADPSAQVRKAACAQPFSPLSGRVEAALLGPSDRRG